MAKERNWKIDRRVPLALIVTLLLQLAGGLIWASQLDARVGTIEQLTVSSSGLGEKFARLEERLDHVKEDLGALQRQLSYLTERLVKP